MKNEVKTTNEVGHTHIQIEGDNKTLIKALQRKIQIPCEIQTLIEGTTFYLQSCIKVNVVHTFREGDCPADSLAQFS